MYIWHLLQALVMVLIVVLVVGGGVSAGLILLSRLEAALPSGNPRLIPAPIEPRRGR